MHINSVIYNIVIAFIFTVFAIFFPYGANAHWQWAHGAGGNNNDIGNTIVTDNFGNVYISGVFSSASISFGTFTLINDSVGTNDIFVVKYDSIGNVVWANSFGGKLDDNVNTITTDNAGNVIIAGSFFSSSISFASTTLHNYGYPSFFLAKLNNAGSVLWSKTCDTSYNHPNIAENYATSVITDANGCVFVTIYLVGSIVFGTDTLQTALYDQYSSILLKYNATGNFLWAKMINAEAYRFVELYSVCTDTIGNIFVTGATNGSIFYASPMSWATGCSGWKHFVLKLDSMGNGKKMKSICSYDYYSYIPYHLAVFSPNQIYVTGEFGNTNDSIITFGSTTLINHSFGTSDIFLAKYDSNLNIVWVKHAGGDNNETPNSICTDDSGKVYITGTFMSSSLAFGTSTLNNTSTSNFFAVKYDSSGNVVWAKNANDTGSNFGNGIAVNNRNDVYITGSFNSNKITFGSNVLTNNLAGTDDVFLAKYQQNGLVQVLNTIEEKEVHIYPNPISHNDNLHITFPNNLEANKFVVFNIYGSEVLSDVINSVNSNFQLICSQLKAGVYYLQILGSKYSKTVCFSVEN